MIYHKVNNKVNNSFLKNFFLISFFIIVFSTYILKSYIFFVFMIKDYHPDYYFKCIEESKNHFNIPPTINWDYQQNFWVILHALFMNTFYFFTAQSNFLVLIVVSLYFTKFKNHCWYPLIAFIALIDICLTGVVHNVINEPFYEIKSLNKTFLSISLFEHFYIPLLYLFFYFSSLNIKSNHTLTYKKAYLSLIHPLVYINYSVFLGTYYEQKIYRYPYAFMNPNSEPFSLSYMIFNLFKIDRPQQGLLGVFIFGFILFIILCLVIPLFVKLKKTLLNSKPLNKKRYR